MAIGMFMDRQLCRHVELVVGVGSPADEPWDLEFMVGRHMSHKWWLE
jgi:hypothetical protein